MKKSIIALSVIAATSAAQAQNVTVTGIADAMYLTGKHFGQGYKEVQQNGARTSSIQIIGSEDLGGGLRANFRYEVQPLFVAGDGNGYNQLVNDNGAVIADGTAQRTAQASQQSGLVGKGYSFVGLSGGFGAVEFGTINSPSFAAFANMSGSLGTGIGSGYGVTFGSTSTNVFTRFENAVLYRTPTMNGVTLSFLASPGNDSQWGTSSAVVLRRNSVQDWGLQYVNGPLTLRGAQMYRKASPKEAAGTAGITTTTSTVSASYTINGIRLGAGASNVSTDAAAGARSATEAYGFTASMPLGSLRLLASVTNLSVEDTTTANVAFKGKKATITGMGAEYDFSKRTFVYARYETGVRGNAAQNGIIVNGAVQGAGGATTPVTNDGVSRFGVGVSHQF